MQKIAKSIIKNTTITRIKLPFQKTSYIIGGGLLTNLHKIPAIRRKNYTRFLVLSDKTVNKLYGEKVAASLDQLQKEVATVVISAGEMSKSLNYINIIASSFFQKRFGKRSALVSLGGGVVTDLGGFAASMLIRGVATIHIPTTLVGQIDAAIGGKSAVNFWISGIMLKNMIGGINQPQAVVSDIELLRTLPEKEVKNGLSEMIKYFIGWRKPDIKDILKIKDIKKAPEDTLTNVVTQCQKIKIDIIVQDPLNTKGIREKLNLGHTLGHAIEGASNGQVSHGEAVSVGIAASAWMSREVGLLDDKVFQSIIGIIKKLGLPTKISNIDKNKVVKALLTDKKEGRFVLIETIGKLKIKKAVEEKVIKKMLQVFL